MQSWYTWSWFGLQISIQCNLLLATNPFEQSTIETSLIETRLHSERYYKLGSNDQNTSEKNVALLSFQKPKVSRPNEFAAQYFHFPQRIATKLPWNEIISLWSYFRLDACMEKKPFDCIPDENIWQSGNTMCEHSNTQSQCLNSNAHHVNPIFAWTQISSRCCVQICVRDSVQTPLWIL